MLVGKPQGAFDGEMRNLIWTFCSVLSVRMPIDGVGNGGRFAQLDERCLLDQACAVLGVTNPVNLGGRRVSDRRRRRHSVLSSGPTMAKIGLCRSEASDEEVQSEPDVVEGKHLARASRTLHRQVSRAWYVSLE